VISVGLLESLPWRGSARSHRERIASAHWSAVLFFLAAIGLLAYCLFDYRVNWMHRCRWCRHGVPARRLGCQVVCTVAAIYLGYVSFTWCLAFNAAWIPMHYPQHDLRSENHFTASQVVDYWMAVRRGEDVRSLPLQPKEQWLADLMDNWRQRHGVQLPARSAP
jgi:hypothetical protein